MNPRTQGLLLAFVGAVMLRLSLSDAYLQYVTSWMKWPIAASGLLLLLLAIGPIGAAVLPTATRADPATRAGSAADGEPAGHDHSRHGGVPYVTWLLVLPGLVAFLIAPPALGAYLAERRAGEVVAAPATAPTAVAAGEVVPLEVQDFAYRAQDGGSTMAGRTVDLTGFVSYDDQGRWFVTRMAIGCCAADAASYRVQVNGAEAPPRDQWVTVTGVYVDGTGLLNEAGTELRSNAAVEASQVVETVEPAQTYS